jgi:hypothetical protein
VASILSGEKSFQILVVTSGLPDSQTKNSNLDIFWIILRTENIGIFYGHLVYFTLIWYILCPFGIFYGHLVYFVVIWTIFPVLVRCSKKNLATLRFVVKTIWKTSISELRRTSLTEYLSAAIDH